jgi:Holliday junction resolvase RusA-like endonuclease
MKCQLTDTQVKITIDETPPSLNHAYIHSCKGGKLMRFKSKEANSFISHMQAGIPTEYETWITENKKSKRVTKFWIPWENELSMRIHIVFPDERRRDLDNYWKLAIDSLKGKVFKDDSQIKEIIVTKSTSTGVSRIDMDIRPYSFERKEFATCPECGCQVRKDSMVRTMELKGSSEKWVCESCL